MQNRQHNWIISVCINLTILLFVMLFAKMVYETNDDYAIASRIADGYPTVNFINYYLCLGLSALQSLITTVNIYVASQIIASFVALVCILKIIIDRADSKIVIVAISLAITIFSFDHYSSIQFTKTAALLSTAALIILLDAATEQRPFGYYLVGVALLYVGSMLRIDGLVIAIAFAFLHEFFSLLDDRHNLRERFTAKRIAIYTLIAVMTLSCYAVDHASNKANVGSAELASYMEYNDYRYRVVDFPVYKHYEELADDYSDAGLSENDLFMIGHWYFDYDGAASKDNLKTIVNISEDLVSQPSSIMEAVRSFIKETVKSVRTFDATGIHLLLISILALWVLLTGRPIKKVYVLMVGILTASVYIYLYYVQRPVYRALYVADIASLLWLCYTASSISTGFGKESSSSKLKRIVSVIMSLALICSSLACLVPSRSVCKNQYEKASKRIISSELDNYIQSRPDRFFVFATQEKKSNPSYLKPLSPPDTASEQNMMGTGSWGTMSPYILSKLSKYDMHNPIKDLIDNENAYYVGNKNISRLTEYYNKWYGSPSKRLYLQLETEIDGMKIWSVHSESQS